MGGMGMTVQHDKKKPAPGTGTLARIAEAFVSARQDARALDAYPGSIPLDLSTAYEIQEFAIDLWPDELGGWKVGRIPPDVEGQFGSDRLAGPIFAHSIVKETGGKSIDMRIFADGFGAVEAEFVAVIAADAPADKLDWTRDEADAMIADLRIGLEVASSPLGTINDLGPAVTASDFGNNSGLIVGASISDWRDRDPESLSCETFVDGESVGIGGAYRLTGGVVRSVQFILELAAARGRPLRAGSLIATGQTTGIHDVTPGQSARIVFAGAGEVACRIVAVESPPRQT